MSFFSGKARSNFHRGVLKCECAHAMGELRWPLDGTVHSDTETESHGKCVWQCCNQGWSNGLCTVVVAEAPVVPPPAPKAPPATVSYDSAIYGKSMSILLHPKDIAAHEEAKKAAEAEAAAAAAEAEKEAKAHEAAHGHAEAKHVDENGHEHDHGHEHAHGHEHEHGHGHGHEHKPHAEEKKEAENGFLGMPSFGMPTIDPMAAGMAMFEAKPEEPEEEKNDKVKQTHVHTIALKNAFPPRTASNNKKHTRTPHA